MYYAQKALGMWIDWVELEKYLKKQNDILQINYYVGLKGRISDNKFLKKLKKIKFHLITKPIKTYKLDGGISREKANFDVEITADALIYPKKYDILILLSGDSDFLYLVNILKKRDIKTIVYSSRKFLAWEYKFKTEYHFIEELPILTKAKQFVKIQ